MKKTITLNDFQQAFVDMGREDQFSWEALGLIFNHIEEYERDTGEETELDVIAICCEWAEDTPEAIARDYGIDLTDMYPGDIPQAVMDYLCDNTTVLEMTDQGTIVYVCF